MKDLRVIFMGTPDFGVPILEALIDNCNVIAVVSQPDKPSNRCEIKYSPIKSLALSKNIKVYQPISIRTEFKEILEEKPDIIITCAYGQIIPKEILDNPKYGCINVHASLLPKLRGGAPIHWAIINGDDKSGITIMKMALKMDAGDIISQESIDILDTDTVGSLHDKLSILGRDLLLKTLPNIISGNVSLTKQDESMVTFGWNIKKEDERIDFNKTSREIINQIRGLNPWPVAYSILNGKIIKIWGAKHSDNYPPSNCINGQITKLYEDGIGVKTGNGEIIITELQLEGRNRMAATDFINGVVNKELLVGRIFE